MIIGILYEGEYDFEPLKIITTKIIREVSKTTAIKFIPYKCNGGIFTKKEEATKVFFNATPPCDFAIFLNDMDKYKERCRSLKSYATAIKSKDSTKDIIVTCPDPSLEEWFFIEENAIKKVFKLDSLSEIEKNNKHPKKVLQHLIREYGDITESNKSIYKKIAELLYLQTLKLRSREFEKFHEATSKIVKKLLM